MFCQNLFFWTKIRLLKSVRHEACHKESSLPSLEANTVMKNVMSLMTFKDMITFYLSGGLTFIKEEFKCLNNFLFRFVLLFKSVLVPLKGRTTISFACSENSSGVHAMQRAELLMMKKLHMMHRICLSTLHSRGKRDFFFVKILN